MTERLKVAVIAGEVSGDLLGADLIRALKARYPGSIELVGVGGEALEGQGLTSLFDYSELSIMGFTQVLKKLPKLIGLINRAAEAVIREKPDVLLIIDSPDFTHRVAKSPQGTAASAGRQLCLPERLGLERTSRHGDVILCGPCPGSPAI